MQVRVVKTGYDQYDITLAAPSKRQMKRYAWTAYYGGIATFVGYRYYRYRIAQ